MENFGKSAFIENYDFTPYSIQQHQGLIRNALTKVPEVYGKNWVVRVYTNETNNFLRKLGSLKHVDVCYVPDLEDVYGIPVKGMFFTWYLAILA